MRRILLGVVAVVVVGFLAIQLVPYGRDHTNPPATGEPAWDSPETRAMAVASTSLSAQFTPARWSQTVRSAITRLQHDLDLVTTPAPAGGRPG